jgi:phage shock protein C
MAKGTKKKDTPKKSNKLDSQEVVRQRLYDFKDEVHAAGRKTHERVRRGDFTYDSWYSRTFGVIGPLFSSVFGLIVLLFFVWILENSALFLGSNILFALHDFIYENLEILFLMLLFFSYSSYFSRHYPKIYLPVSPIVKAISATVFLWIVAGAIEAINVYKGNDVLNAIVLFIDSSLVWLFAFFIFIGYIILILKLLIDKPFYRDEIEAEEKTRKVSQTSAAKYYSNRIYRSGTDRVLGGVCGGIAEYLGVDPVIIRILWIAATLAWGAGILLYIIAWIIIPRNPKDEW